MILYMHARIMYLKTTSHRVSAIMCTHVHIICKQNTSVKGQCTSEVIKMLSLHIHTCMSVTVSCVQDEVFQSEVVFKQTNPTWKSNFQWRLNAQSKFLTVTIVDHVR